VAKGQETLLFVDSLRFNSPFYGSSDCLNRLFRRTSEPLDRVVGGRRGLNFFTPKINLPTPKKKPPLID
jgi:hypothetical protein